MPKSCLKYPVDVVDDVFGESKALAEALGEAGVLIVADMNVVQRHSGLGVKIGKYASENGIQLAGPPVVMGGGEKLSTTASGCIMVTADICLFTSVSAMPGAFLSSHGFSVVKKVL